MNLGVCLSCGAAQYPFREVCVRCLSDSIDVQEREVIGTIVSLTKIHRSLVPNPTGGPTAVASVKMDVGPIAISFVAPAVKIGTRVRLSGKKNGNSELLIALPLTAGQ